MDVGIEVYKAVAAVTSAMAGEGIAKNRSHMQGYKFRGIDDVYASLGRKLADAKLCIIPRIVSRTAVERTTAKGGAMFYVTVEAEFDIVSAVDGSRHTARAVGEAMDSADKATNKAMSAAYKYMAFMLFCVPTEGDNDADATTYEVASFDASGARAKIAALPHVTPQDNDDAAKLGDRESLVALYKAIESRAP